MEGMRLIESVIKDSTGKKLSKIEGIITFSETQQNDWDDGAFLLLRIDSETCDIFLYEQDKLSANLRVGDRVKCYFEGIPITNVDLKAYELINDNKVITRGIKKGYRF